MPSPSSTIPSLLLTLPNELLHQIALNLQIIQNGQVVDVYDLSSFSLTCKRVHDATVSALFGSAPIASEAQLESLGAVRGELLGHLRHLNLFLDSPFLSAWRTFLDSSSPSSVTEQTYFFSGPPIFVTFAHILSLSPHLRSLSFKVAESMGPGSVWRKFGATPPSVLSLEPLVEALEMQKKPWSLSIPPTPADTKKREWKFPNLVSLRIDGFEGLGPLLRMTPNLATLECLKSGGFDQSATCDLLEHLSLLPSLRSLAFSPNSIAVSHRRSEALGEGGEGGRHSAGLIKAIGRACPGLRRLSLQTRWLGYGVFLVPMGAEAEDLIDALTTLPNLTHLYLPISLQIPSEILLFKEWRHPPSTTHGTTGAGGMRALLESQRRHALERAEERELETIREMQDVCRRLGTVAFVRFADAHVCNRSVVGNGTSGRSGRGRGKAEVSVEYRFDEHVVLDEGDEAGGLEGDGSVQFEDVCLECQETNPVTREVRVPRASFTSSSLPSSSSTTPAPTPGRKIQITLHDASEGFEDANPFSLRFARLNSLSPSSLTSSTSSSSSSSYATSPFYSLSAVSSNSNLLQFQTRDPRTWRWSWKRVVREMWNLALGMMFLAVVLALVWEQSGMSRLDLVMGNRRLRMGDRAGESRGRVDL